MFSNLVATAFMLGIFVMVFWTPATFARGIMVLDHEQLTSSEKVLTKIPLLNVIMAEKIYRGKASLVGISTVSLIALLGVRLLCVFMFPSVGILQLLTVTLFLLSLAASLITNIVLIWTVLTDTDATSFTTKLLLSVAFPLGQYYVGNFLPTVIKNLGKEEETFK